MNNAKWWARSRIIILNTVAALAACIVLLEPVLPQIKQLVPEQAYGWLALAVSLATIYLRTQTTKPLARRKRAARRTAQKP